MNPSGGQIPPSKQQPDPRLEVPAVIPSSDCPIIVGSPHLGEDLTAILPLSATNGTGKSLFSTNGIQSRASPYDWSPGGGATRRKGSRRFRRENTQSKYSPLLSDLRVADFIQETASIGAQELPLSMRVPTSPPPVVGLNGPVDSGMEPEYPTLLKNMDSEMSTQVETTNTSPIGHRPGVPGSPKASSVDALPSQSKIWSQGLTNSVSYADRCKGISGCAGTKL
ncbi:hypothetical protein L1987_19167 [Smallanthus sonchifolius]|uniref:Uncharacterized protein n=1 Tax=Smallanthus sonchifolius TaxID=185202 RepID=A0ACB9J2S0_9ASTR|nr:hypothetical protein L1987_19167 [Smallanthus sonchifolius]